MSEGASPRWSPQHRRERESRCGVTRCQPLYRHLQLQSERERARNAVESIADPVVVVVVVDGALMQRGNECGARVWGAVLRVVMAELLGQRVRHLVVAVAAAVAGAHSCVHERIYNKEVVSE